VLFDLASLQSTSQVLGVLVKEFHAFRNVRRLAVRVPEGWCEVRSEPSVLKVVSWPGAPPSVANVACALALPGVMQDPRAWVECMEWGVPVLHYPGGDDSPLQTCVAERARLTVTTTSELIATLDAAADPSSEFHADLVRATRRRLRTQEIAGVVDQLLKMRLADVALA
jgi:hypothetical protein